MIVTNENQQGSIERANQSTRNRSDWLCFVCIFVNLLMCWLNLICWFGYWRSRCCRGRVWRRRASAPASRCSTWRRRWSWTETFWTTAGTVWAPCRRRERTKARSTWPRTRRARLVILSRTITASTPSPSPCSPNCRSWPPRMTVNHLLIRRLIYISFFR